MRVLIMVDDNANEEVAFIEDECEDPDEDFITPGFSIHYKFELEEELPIEFPVNEILRKVR